MKKAKINKWQTVPLELPKGYKMVIFGGQILIDKELRNLLKEAGFKKF